MAFCLGLGVSNVGYYQGTQQDVFGLKISFRLVDFLSSLLIFLVFGFFFLVKCADRLSDTYSEGKKLINLGLGKNTSINFLRYK